MKKHDFVLNDLENVDPSPIAPRVCRCDCKLTFQPRRSDHEYINKRHGDKDYYEKVTKPKRKVRNEIEKIHRKNDSICGKYVQANNGNPFVRNWESIEADGLNHSYIQGTLVENELKWVFTYNYMYTVFKEGEVIKIKIKKR